MEIWRGYVHPHTHPHTQLKKSSIPHTHTHTQSMRGFPIKTGTGSGNTHGDGFICHLYSRTQNLVFCRPCLTFFVFFVVFQNKLWWRLQTLFFFQILFLVRRPVAISVSTNDFWYTSMSFLVCLGPDIIIDNIKYFLFMHNKGGRL